MKDTDVLFVCGRRRTGKSASVKIEIARTARLLVWDSTAEYGRDLRNVSVAKTRRALIRLLKSSRRGALRVCFQPGPGGMRFFDWFCRVAMEWGSCTVVVEELASVTTPAKAPAGWGDLVRLSAHCECNIIAITQRPAEVDKTVLGNASRVRCFAMARVKDVSYMAGEMRMPAEQLDKLPLLHYYERNTGTQKMRRGKLPWAA